MELVDLQSLFGLHVYRCTIPILWLRPRSPHHFWAHIRGRYWSAKKDDISLFVTPWCQAKIVNRPYRYSTGTLAKGMRDSTYKEHFMRPGIRS
jgi:hypothetical protein